ncbi:MAG: hypothetical protein KC766_07050 [Myxococcales bacterium]|nr:hypothetical protein [Myxococcales bacterium]
MTRIAVLDDRLPAQIRENPGAFEGVDLVWTGTDVEQLKASARLTRPSVLIVNVELLGGHSPENLTQLLDATHADLVLCLYTFARREALEAMNQGKLRAIRVPVSLATLRTQMMSVIVRQLLSSDADQPRRDPEPVEAPVFTSAQLGRLQEVRSTIDCECPNHLAELVIGLRAFEEYSARCSSKDDRDRDVHRSLNQAAARARHEMEQALLAVVKHEGIVI